MQQTVKKGHIILDRMYCLTAPQKPYLKPWTSWRLFLSEIKIKDFLIQATVSGLTCRGPCLCLPLHNKKTKVALVNYNRMLSFMNYMVNIEWLLSPHNDITKSGSTFCPTIQYTESQHIDINLPSTFQYGAIIKTWTSDLGSYLQDYKEIMKIVQIYWFMLRSCQAAPVAKLDWSFVSSM